MKKPPPAEQSDTTQYFFDLPIKRVIREANMAMRLIYFGSEFGAISTFGLRKYDPVDLDEAQVIKVNLSHLAESDQAEDFDFCLVFFRKETAKHLWEERFARDMKQLRKITRRVTLTAKQVTEPKRVKTFYLTCNRPVYMAKYERLMECDNYVPAEYVSQLNRDFEAFLVRCPKHYPLIRNFLENLGNQYCDQRHRSTHHMTSETKVCAYV